MACLHNQNKIDALNVEIESKKLQIEGLKSNISKCMEIKNNYEEFNIKINCVIKNLAGNTVIDGESYDKGKMAECLTKSNDKITDCNDIIKQSQLKIDLLEIEINDLETEIDSLQGDCSYCVVSLSANSGDSSTVTI